MRIDGAAPVRKADSAKKPAKLQGSGFAAFMSDGVEETGASMPASSISALSMLNEVEDAVSAPRKAIKHGNDILDELEKIRDGLLFGGISVSRLESVQRMIAKKDSIVTDPKLAEILEEIEIRAAVELAKLGRF